VDRPVSRHLGIDLGGTNVKVAVLERDADGSEPPRVVATTSAPTRADRGPQAVVARLGELGREAMAAHGPVETVGVGLPGLFDPRAGTILLFPNLPGPWRGHPVAEPLARALGQPVVLVNDVRAFTLAEARLGAARGCRTVVCMALGTGVGGGLIVNGRLHLGIDGTAGEIGHQTVVPDGPRCGCGNRGCVEAVASARAIAEAGGRATVADVVAAARAGDERAREAIARAAGYLGIAIANAVVLLSPDRVVIGGGVAGAGDVLLEPIRAEVRRRVSLAPADRIDIVPGALGPVAGAIGAALRGLEARLEEQA
jgi:glucokinase